jgi:hypothetical protein
LRLIAARTAAYLYRRKIPAKLLAGRVFFVEWGNFRVIALTEERAIAQWIAEHDK